MSHQKASRNTHILMQIMLNINSDSDLVVIQTGVFCSIINCNILDVSNIEMSFMAACTVR